MTACCSGGAPARLYGRAPDALHGLIEARGVGVLGAPALPFAEVSLAVRHAAGPERQPEAERRGHLGVEVRALALDLLHPATPCSLALTLASDCLPHGLESAFAGRI
jgi:serine kinase of HPr protein (carbohydrate metabolism regulator)